jgi:hypothetical protein
MSGYGRIVPAYAMTGGRTRSVYGDLPLEAMVMTTAEGLRVVVDLQFENRSIVLLCRHAISIAEVAARVGIPLGVARVLVSDLTEHNHLAVQVPQSGSERPSRAILDRLLAGLES